MKKTTVAALYLSFLLAASPVYAAGNGMSDFFSGLFNFFGIHLPTQAPPFEPFESLTPMPTYSVPPGQRDSDTRPGFVGTGVAPSVRGIPTTGTAGTSGVTENSRRDTDHPLRPIISPRGTSHEESRQSYPGDNWERGVIRATSHVESNQPFPENGRGSTGPRGASSNADRGHTDAASKSGRMKTVVTRMFDSFQNRLDNYGEFLKKVQTRRDKLSAEGKDVAKLDAFIKTAKDSMADAQAVLTNNKNTAMALDYSATPGSVISKVRDLLTTVRQSFTAMHKSMSTAVAEIVTASLRGTSVNPDRQERTTGISGRWTGGPGNGNWGGSGVANPGRGQGDDARGRRP